MGQFIPGRRERTGYVGLAEVGRLLLRLIQLGADLAEPVRRLVPHGLGRSHHAGHAGEGALHVLHRRGQRDPGAAGFGELPPRERHRAGEFHRRSVKHGGDLFEFPVGRAARRRQLGGLVHDRRIRGEDLPQGGQVGGGRFPAPLGLTGQGRPGEHPVAEAAVQLQQVRLDAVALGGRDRHASGGLLAGHLGRHGFTPGTGLAGVPGPGCRPSGHNWRPTGRWPAAAAAPR